jgi:hypothetical protein
MFLNHFDVLMSKIIFKNKKNIILIYFWVKKKIKKQSQTYSQILHAWLRFLFKLYIFFFWSKIRGYRVFGLG